MTNILWFKNINKSDVATVGGKGANLGEMYNIGLPIPAGFVITAKAFKQFLDISGLGEKIFSLLRDLDIQETEKLHDVSEKIQEMMIDAKMPEDIKKDILKAYDNLNIDIDILKNINKKGLSFIKAGRDLPFVAVRSSATAEDLPSISEDEYVFVKINNKPFFGKMKNLAKNLSPNDEIYIPAMDNFEVEWKRVSDVYKHKADKKELFKITTSTGKQITISPNHTLIVLDEERLEPKFVNINELKGNEKVPVIRTIPSLEPIESIDVLNYINKNDVAEHNNKIMIKNNSSNWKIQQGLPRTIKIDKELAYFLGIYTAEGTTYKTSIIVTNTNKEILNKIKSYISSLGINADNKINKHSLRVYCKTLTRLLNQNCSIPNKGIRGKGKTCGTKEVPSFIFSASKEIIGEYLKGCFDGDGCVEKNAITYTSKSEKLIAGLSVLLQILNIEHYLLNKKRCFNITIARKDIISFREKIGFFDSVKSKKLDYFITSYKNQKKYYDFKNSINISNNIAQRIRYDIEKNIPKQNMTVALCPLCTKEINKGSKYKEKIRYYCNGCKKAFYEDKTIKVKVEKYINYDSKGRILKGSIPWNKSINTYPNYSPSKLKEITDNRGVSQITKIFSKSIIWDKIIKIEAVPYDSWVYDFTVPNIENFSAGFGGIITHNTASFAGQQATFLNVKGNEAIINAVMNCWASLYTARAIYYRVKNNFPHEKVLIAVVIQKMVNSTSSGVAFSINPSTNEDDIVIESGFGLGEAIVGGEIEPDHYVVDKYTFEIKSKKMNYQKFMYIKDENYGRTIKKTLSELQGREQKLNDMQIVTLAKLVKKIEEHYGKPQDTEFAVENGKVYMVQARPVTTTKKIAETAKVEEIKEIPVLIGLGAGPGIGTGTVKIVRTASDLWKIQKGDILVTEMTNPDYVVAMQKANGIITDQGGITCFGGDTKILTNVGFKTIEETHNLIKDKEQLLIFSYDYKNKKPCWKRIINSGKRLRESIKISVSQKGILEHNTLDITPDHKMFTFNNRDLIKKELKNILDQKECLCLVEKLPVLNISKNKDKEAYLMGALVSDGYIKIDYHSTGNPRRGRVTFTQKHIVSKEAFIGYVKECFYETFNEELAYENVKHTIGNLRGREIRGYASDFICFKLEPALQLTKTVQNLDLWALTLNESASFNFLAGLIDGDGCFYDNRLHIYISKKNVLEATILSCLRLGIIPQITTNRTIHHVQILERMDEILNYTKRVKGLVHKKVQGNKLFSAKQLLGDIIDEINWGGKIKPYVNNNLIIDSTKIKERILPMLEKNSLLSKQINEILNSNLRMNRVKELEKLGNIMVYNLEVEADNELNHNYVVFTEKYTPLLVSNSHASIVSREMGIACVVGTGNATSLLHEGDTVTVDGTHGKIYRGSVAIQQEEQKYYEKYSGKLKTKIYMNLGEPDQIDKYKDLNFDGIGLMRLEFVIASKIGSHPLYLLQIGQEHNYIDGIADSIGKVAKEIFPKPIVVRFSDFKTNEYKDLKGGEKFEPHEDNPMIGWRGVSRYISDEFKEAFKLECRAIKQIRADGYTNVHVMLPFVRTVTEVLECISIMESEGLYRSDEFKIWLMAEVPSIAFLAEEFAQLPIDGCSIGSNDLTQLVLGVDRDSSILGKMGYFNERNEAVLKAIENIIVGFRKYGKTVSICGQAPSEYPEIVEFLVKHDVNSISVNPDVVEKTRSIVSEVERNL